MSPLIYEFAQAMQGLLDEEIENAKDDMSFNRCATIEDYKHLAGRIQGLRFAKQHVDALLEKVKTRDD